VLAIAACFALVYISHFHCCFLAAHCYAKVRTETEAMQSAIQAELGLNPVEQEVVVLYEGEKVEQPTEFWKVSRFFSTPQNPN
jgi:large subunit ribosomal protein L32